MIETSLIAWMKLGALLVSASLAGLSLSYRLPWKENAWKTSLPLFVGLALGPFLVGLLSVLALGCFAGAAHSLHLAVVFAGLISLTVFAACGDRKQFLQSFAKRQESDRRIWLLTALLLTWLVVLLINTIMLPLTQNDSLEYATVGRILFEARTMAAYPAVHPDSTSSGFYGPWTHPPLYVAMIYMSHVLQGHADAPGLMRMIAPWFALAAVGVVCGIGSLVSRLTGVVAALVFISTPLFYLGVDSALIDALPILGFTLIMAALAGLGGGILIRSAVIGIALGMALWTHSQAILFIPLTAVALVLDRGWRNWRYAIRELALVIIVAAALSAWPYVRNYTIFGALISDNPAVFALPEQDWPEYFRVVRGIDNWPAIIQYGVLKGWFALEAYGPSFWFMTFGAVTYLFFMRDRSKRMERTDTVSPQGLRVFLLAFSLIVCYLAGVVASVILGMDLMIKNERYMLVILPAVSIVAALGLTGFFLRAQEERRFIFGRWLITRRKLNNTAILALVVISAAQLSTLTIFRFHANNLSISKLGRNFEDTLKNRPEYQVVRYLRLSSPRGALVLSLKPADMYYADRKMISYLDPRMIPFYKETDPVKGLKYLRNLGITYIHSPDYSLPPLYGSVLHSILSDPKLSTLQFSADGNQIFSLRPESLIIDEELDITPGKIPWTRSTNVLIGGRKALAGITATIEKLNENRVSYGGPPIPAFHRDWSTSLRSEEIWAKGGQEYGIDLRLRGNGLVHVWLHQTNSFGPVRDRYARSQTRMLIGDVVLSPEHPERSFNRRIRLLDATETISIEVEHIGTSSLQLKKVAFMPLVSEQY